MKTKFKYIKCCRCEGSGKVKRLARKPYTKYPKELIYKAAMLIGDGTSLRKTAKILGLSHPQIAKNLCALYLNNLPK